MVTAVENKDDRLSVGGPTLDVVVALIQGEMYRVADACPIGLKISHVGSAVGGLLLKCEPLAIRSYARASHAKSSPVCDPFRPLNRFAYVRVKPHRPVVAAGTESLGFFDRIDQPSIGQPGNITVCLPHFGGCKHRDGRSPVQVVAQDGIAARIGPDEKAWLPLFVPKEIQEPSGKTDSATAFSRSLRGAPPSTETIQMLEACDDQVCGSSPARCALATNLALSGNQAADTISHATLLLLNSSGWRTDWVSSVSICLICIPFLSA